MIKRLSILVVGLISLLAVSLPAQASTITFCDTGYTCNTTWFSGLYSGYTENGLDFGGYAYDYSGGLPYQLVDYIYNYHYQAVEAANWCFNCSVAPSIDWTVWFNGSTPVNCWNTYFGSYEVADGGQIVPGSLSQRSFHDIGWGGC